MDSVLFQLSVGRTGGGLACSSRSNAALDLQILRKLSQLRESLSQQLEL